MAYLPSGGGQSGSDNTAELEKQTDLLTSIDTELEDQGGTLDTIETNTGNTATNTSGIKSDTASIVTNTSNISTDTGNIATDAAAIEAELLAQGLVQDDQKIEQIDQGLVLNAILLQLQILTKHWEKANDEIITERDLL